MAALIYLIHRRQWSYLSCTAFWHQHTHITELCVLTCWLDLSTVHPHMNCALGIAPEVPNSCNCRMKRFSLSNPIGHTSPYFFDPRLGCVCRNWQTLYSLLVTLKREDWLPHENRWGFYNYCRISSWTWFPLLKQTLIGPFAVIMRLFSLISIAIIAPIAGFAAPAGQVSYHARGDNLCNQYKSPPKLCTPNATVTVEETAKRAYQFYKAFVVDGDAKTMFSLIDNAYIVCITYQTSWNIAHDIVSSNIIQDMPMAHKLFGLSSATESQQEVHPVLLGALTPRQTWVMPSIRQQIVGDGSMVVSMSMWVSQTLPEQS